MTKRALDYLRNTPEDEYNLDDFLSLDDDIDSDANEDEYSPEELIIHNFYRSLMEGVDSERAITKYLQDMDKLRGEEYNSIVQAMQQEQRDTLDKAAADKSDDTLSDIRLKNGKCIRKESLAGIKDALYNVAQQYQSEWSEDSDAEVREMANRDVRDISMELLKNAFENKDVDFFKTIGLTPDIFDANGDGDVDTATVDTDGNGSADAAVVAADSKDEAAKGVAKATKKLTKDSKKEDVTSTGKTEEELEDNDTRKNVTNALLDHRFN